MKKLIILLFLVFLLNITLISAQQEEIRFYHERNTNLTIYEKCRIKGEGCDANFGCNVTVLDPSQVVRINNQNMSRGEVYYNFTTSGVDVNVNGVYETTVDCANTTDFGSNTFFFQVTPNGSAPIDQGQSIILFGGIILLIIIAVFIGWLGFRTDNGVVSISLLAFAILILVFGLGMILNVFELSFGTFGDIVSNYSTIYVLFIILVGVGILGLIVWLIYLVVQWFWKKRGLIDGDLE